MDKKKIKVFLIEDVPDYIALVKEMLRDTGKARFELEYAIERKKMGKRLQEAEKRLSSMLQSIGDHMSMTDKDLNIIWANETAKKIFGNEIIGKKCYEAYHKRKEPCEPYPCITLKAFRDGKVHTHETQVMGQDGKTIYFHENSE